mmetsp:Transcript_3082/g.6180  ORF Transcript_3082/g.6180 Transcript_3082/m.6180 type:complete len:270 (+) Transcript_3082:85-894(+)
MQQRAGNQNGKRLDIRITGYSGVGFLKRGPKLRFFLQGGVWRRQLSLCGGVFSAIRALFILLAHAPWPPMGPGSPQLEARHPPRENRASRTSGDFGSSWSLEQPARLARPQRREPAVRPRRRSPDLGTGDPLRAGKCRGAGAPAALPWCALKAPESPRGGAGGSNPRLRWLSSQRTGSPRRPAARPARTGQKPCRRPRQRRGCKAPPFGQRSGRGARARCGASPCQLWPHIWAISGRGGRSQRPPQGLGQLAAPQPRHQMSQTRERPHW